MLALDKERRAAEAGEVPLATHLKTGTYWHVAIPKPADRGARALSSAAARALRALEDKRPPQVRVDRSGGKIQRYFLTPAGRSRAEELLANDGMTAKAARRKARDGSTSRRTAAARKLTKKRQELEALLFDMDSPLLKRALEAPLNDQIHANGETYRTFAEVPGVRGLWQHIEDPVDQLIFVVLELAFTRNHLRSAKSSTRRYLEAVQHNDSAWPEYRAHLIAQGVNIAPDADWRDLPLKYMLEPPLKWPGISVNPLVLAATVDNDHE